MWIITSINTGEVFNLIKEKPKYVVGRAGADIILKDDTSISRAHAVLQLEIDPNGSNAVVLVDTESKYGTYHNDGITSNSKITPNEPIKLRDGDRIRFGLLKNEWKLSKFDIKCMSSALSNDDTKSLQHYINSLGGSIIPKWESGCSHLTMNELNITVKVLYALLNDIPIVTCEYWKDVLSSARKNQAVLPRAKNYLPRKGVLFVDKNELDYTYRSERKSLFSGKTFVFMHKTHFDTYGPLVEQAGGNITDLNSGVQKTLLIKENVVVIQYVPSTQSQSQSSQTINSINDYLKSNSKRIIPEYEIGLAVVLCSMEKYCNPNGRDLSELMPATEPAAFADDMRIGDTKSVSGSDLEIPETDQTTPSLNSVTATDEAMPNIAFTPSINTESESRKRPAITSIDEDSNDDFNGYFSHQAKKPNLQTHIKPLPIIIQKKNTINVWLNKTQTESSLKEFEDASAEKQPHHATKRGRIAVINDGDSGDENDLFNFGSSGSASNAKKVRIDNDVDRNEADSDEELFDFKKPSTENALNANSEVLDPTQEFVPKEKPQSNGVVASAAVKRKIIPEKVSTEGWLCCSFNQMNVEQIKTEIKSEIKTEDEMTLEQKQYIDSLKGGIEVRIGAIKICSKENDTKYDANILSNGTSNGTTKNFKAFVKKCNYVPQNKVIGVVRVPVDPLRRI